MTRDSGAGMPGTKIYDLLRLTLAVAVERTIRIAQSTVSFASEIRTIVQLFRNIVRKIL